MSVDGTKPRERVGYVGDYKPLQGRPGERVNGRRDDAPALRQAESSLTAQIRYWGIGAAEGSLAAAGQVLVDNPRS